MVNKNKEILNDNNIEFEAPTHNSFKKWFTNATLLIMLKWMDF